MMDAPTYNPANWFWIVGDDESRYWSSAVGAYVETLPEDVGLTRIASEDELTDVLAVYGLPGPLVRVPGQVSPAQAEIALYRYTAGGTLAEGMFLGQVNALIDAHPYELVRIWWRKATYIERDHPYLCALAIELGLADEVVDTLFAEGAKI